MSYAVNKSGFTRLWRRSCEECPKVFRHTITEHLVEKQSNKYELVRFRKYIETSCGPSLNLVV